VSSWTDAASAIQSLVTAGGIIVAGFFTYYKFVKDRIYRPRLELTVDCARVRVGPRAYLHCKLSIGNKGSTKLSLQHDGTVVRVRPGAHDVDVLQAVGWADLDHSAVVAVFSAHDWIESTETIHDEQLIAISPNERTSYKVILSVIVQHPSPRSKQNITISSAQVIPGSHVPPTSTRKDSDDAETGS
jgi:hypothetical protein